MDEISSPAGGPPQRWPPRVAPMLATARSLPLPRAGFGWEFKYDGARIGARVRRDGAVRLDSRNARDLSTSFPEITEAIAQAAPGRTLTVDGEVIAPDPDTGAPDFGLLQQRLGATPTATLQTRVPLSYVVFDLLDLNGAPTTALPYTQRRELLADLELGRRHPRILVPDYHHDIDPVVLLALARDHGLEGVVGKRLDSPYRAGRSLAWIKHALRERISVIVGGWTPGAHGGLGALLVGRFPTPTPTAHPPPPSLKFLGAVGTGWSAPVARKLLTQLHALHTTAPPFATAIPREYSHHAHWVHPQLIADVEYRALTASGYLRHPAFKGLRDDLPPGHRPGR